MFLFVCVIIVVLVFVMFLILKSTVTKINTQTKSYFVDKLQEYDYLIDEKEEKLSQIEKEIKEKELRNNIDDNSIKKDNYEFDYNIIGLLNDTKYQDKNIFDMTKKIEASFNMDYSKIISKFLEEHDSDDAYQFCLELRNKFSSNVIYELKLLNNDELEEKFKSMLSEKEYKIYEVFKSFNERNTLDNFIDYLNELLDLNNPYITVYVGNENDNYDSMSKYVKTMYSKDIYKGIRIVYKNKIYDYSLSERNV